MWNKVPIKIEVTKNKKHVAQLLKVGNSPNRIGDLNNSKNGVNGFKLFNTDNMPITDSLSYIIGDRKNNACNTTGVNHWKSLKNTVVIELINIKPSEKRNNNIRAIGSTKTARLSFAPRKNIKG